jgi:D-psicose/D-tagatose/L-ribulose 3-epimerase
VKLAVSNIAWDADADDAAAALLVREGARGVELAPTKWRAAPFDAPAADVAELRARWEDRGLPIVSLQSLLFGRPDLQLLAGDAERLALLDHLRKVADFAAAVGARALVFGSPKNRVRGERPLEESMHIARDAFRTLAPHARDRGVVFCIEANPPPYGCDFITQTSEAVELCQLADDSSIRVNADLGGMILAGEDPAGAIANAAPYVAHVHASEPHLAQLSTIAAHERAASALAQGGYSGWISIEMRAPAPDEQLGALERAIRFARRAYSTVGG